MSWSGDDLLYIYKIYVIGEIEQYNISLNQHVALEIIYNFNHGILTQKTKKYWMCRSLTLVGGGLLYNLRTS